MDKNTNNNSRINLVDLFLYLLSHWYWFLLCALLCCGYAYYRYAQKPFIYRSTATVIVKDPSSARTTASLSNYSNQINRVDMTNEILQLQSKQLMSQVVTALDADINYTIPIKLRNVELYHLAPVQMHIVRDEKTPDSFQLTATTLDANTLRIELNDGRSAKVALGDTILVYNTKVYFTPTLFVNGDAAGKAVIITKVPVANAAAAFLSRLNITQDEGTILHLSLQDFSIYRANDVLNTLVEKYNEDAIREKNRIAVNTAQFINERLLIIQEELGGVEDQIARFKTSERIMDVDQATTQYLNENKGYNDEIVKVETQLKLAEYLRDHITNSFQSYETIPVNTGLEDAKISNEIAQYNNLILQRDRLLEASSAESPAVKQVEGTLLPLRQNILGSINNLITSLNVRRSDLGSLERESLRKFTAMPSKARQLLSIERQQKIKEDLYIYLLNKREENALTQAMVDNNARMIDSASGSIAPIYPSRNKMLLIALLIGLLIPAVILIARLFLDTRIRSRKDLEDENCSVPFLAELPKAKTKKLKKGEKPDPTKPAYCVSTNKSFPESLRLMVTNLEFMKPEGCTHAVIASTSFNVSAGKTFVTTNIAACLADAKKKVILLDLDLRKRTVSGSFSLKHNTVGLSNYINDEELTIDRIIHQDVMDGVDFIPAGHIPPNPTELLSRQRFDALINELKNRYDYVLLDGVPYNAVADMMVLQRLVDMNLFIIRSGQIDRRNLPALEELYEKKKLKNPCIVLNGTEYKGLYGYGYGYGYGEEKKGLLKRKKKNE